MALPLDVLRLFTNPAATKVIATMDAEGTVHAAPVGSLTATLMVQCLFSPKVEL